MLGVEDAAGSGVERRMDARTIVALAERLAIVETKIGTLKDDTAVIRSTQHDTHNRMQEFVAAERMCASNLAALITSQGTTNTQLQQLAATVHELTLVRAEVEGGWRATVRFGTLIAAGFSALAALATGVAWSLGHLTVHVQP